MQVSSFACCWRYRGGELSCRIVALATDTLKNPSNLPQNRFSPLGWIVVPPEPRNALRRALKREIKIRRILTHTLSCPKTCLLPHQAHAPATAQQAQQRNKRERREKNKFISTNCSARSAEPPAPDQREEPKVDVKVKSQKYAEMSQLHVKETTN